RRFVNVFVGDEECRALAGLDTPVPHRAEMRIIPSVTGGSPAQTRGTGEEAAERNGKKRRTREREAARNGDREQRETSHTRTPPTCTGAVRSGGSGRTARPRRRGRPDPPLRRAGKKVPRKPARFCPLPCLYLCGRGGRTLEDRNG